MSDYKVTDTELISVANAIRTKGGTQAQLEWPSGFVSAIGSISGGSTGSSKNILSGTSSPSANQGNDGDLYLKLGQAENLSLFSKINEGSESVTIDQDKISFRYVGGAAIGGQAYKQIDLTNIDTIEVTVETTSPSYNNYSTPSFSPVFIIENTINPASAYVAPTSIESANGETYRISTQGDTETFIADVSNLTGNYYIVFSGSGTTSVWKNLFLYPNSNADIINSVYLKVNGSWVDITGQDIDDVNTQGSSGGGGGVDLNYELYVRMTQGSITISANDLNKTIEFAWNGGSAIGSNAIMCVIIPKEVQSISFHLAVGTGYSSGSNARFNVGLGLTATPDINGSAGDTNFSHIYQALFLTRSINTEDDYVLDCSNVNVDTVLVLSSIGYNATFSDITFNY